MATALKSPHTRATHARIISSVGIAMQFFRPDTFERRRIDTVRGLACALLVAHHCTLSLTDYRGWDVDTVHRLDAMLSYLRMPVFAFISGLILGITSSPIANVAFVLKKARRLLVPFLAVTVILLVGRAAATGDVTPLDIPYSWIHPHSHMWFLPAAFLFFLASALFSLAADLRQPHGALIFLALALGVSSLVIAAGSSVRRRQGRTAWTLLRARSSYCAPAEASFLETPGPRRGCCSCICTAATHGRSRCKPTHHQHSCCGGGVSGDAICSAAGMDRALFVLNVSLR